MGSITAKEKVISIWTAPWDNETGAPQRRIVHCKVFRFTSPVGHTRVGLCQGEGYFKCGSEEARDWISEFAAFQWVSGEWRKALHVTDIPKPEDPDRVAWYDLPGSTTALLLMARRSGVDGWWSCYNIARTGFRVDAGIADEPVGECTAGIAGEEVLSNPFLMHMEAAPRRRLHAVSLEEDAPELEKEQLISERTSMAIRFSSPYYRVGFRLKSAGLEFLSFDAEGKGGTQENLLALGAGLVVADNDCYAQGPILAPVDEPPACGFLSYDVEGTTHVKGNILTYRYRQKQLGIGVELRFTMKVRSIHLTVTQRVEQDCRLLDSSPFRIAFDARKIPLTVLGAAIKSGETGSVSLPLILCLPGKAAIGLDGDELVRGRFNSIRSHFINTFALEVGEVREPDGSCLLRQGIHQGSMVFSIGVEQPIALRADTPPTVRKAFDRYLYAALPYRADTTTFSNNGNSMGAPICMELWATLCTGIGKGPFGLDAMSLLRDTLEAHLMGAPAYGAGVHASGAYAYEDEYLMTGTSVLLGVAIFLEQDDNGKWYETYKQAIHAKITAMRARDVDGDGLIESSRRRGISGEHQWSTNWYDVISYGFKDAFSNVQLYEALRKLAPILDRCGEQIVSAQLSEWAEHIKAVYADTFMTGNGWLAGWKCMAGQLHDYGFLAVNGAAVSAGLLDGMDSRKVMLNLWQGLRATGYDSFDMGLPGNILPISGDDLAEVQARLPFGGYENGGITLSQSRHFINGLLHVGLEDEAEFLMREISKGMVAGEMIGGVGTGLDWKFWDGVSSGYEGLLADQFGIFEPLINRYGEFRTN